MPPHHSHQPHKSDIFAVNPTLPSHPLCVYHKAIQISIGGSFRQTLTEKKTSTSEIRNKNNSRIVRLCLCASCQTKKIFKQAYFSDSCNTFSLEESRLSDSCWICHWEKCALYGVLVWCFSGNAKKMVIFPDSLEFEEYNVIWGNVFIHNLVVVVDWTKNSIKKELGWDSAILKIWGYVWWAQRERFLLTLRLTIWKLPKQNQSNWTFFLIIRFI